MPTNDDNEAKRKGEEIHRALLPEKRDAEFRARRAAVLKAMENGNREAFDRLLREQGLGGPHREQVLRQFDEYLRTH